MEIEEQLRDTSLKYNKKLLFSTLESLGRMKIQDTYSTTNVEKMQIWITMQIQNVSVQTSNSKSQKQKKLEINKKCESSSW